MGHSEDVTVSLGMSIVVHDLLACMTSENFETIRDEYLGEDSFIADENQDYNSQFRTILEGRTPFTRKEIDPTILSYEQYKQYLVESFSRYGDCQHSRSGSEIQIYEAKDAGNLYNQTLLIPHDTLVNTERWGYNREGQNGQSCPLDLAELAKGTKQIEAKMTKLGISKYTVSLLVSQRGG